jgi:hypothetical protein
MRAKNVWAVLIIVVGVLSALNGIDANQADSIRGKEAASADTGLTLAAAKAATAAAIQEEILGHGKAVLDREKAQRILFILLGVLCSLIGVLMILETRQQKTHPPMVPYPKDMNTRLYPKELETMDDRFTL